MSKKEKVKMYCCVNCGSSFPAYPPDDIHIEATRNEKDYKDYIKVNYRCRECHEVNTIYWGRPEPYGAVGLF